MDRYSHIKTRILELAKADDDIKAVVYAQRLAQIATLNVRNKLKLINKN